MSFGLELFKAVLDSDSSATMKMSSIISALLFTMTISLMSGCDKGRKTYNRFVEEYDVVLTQNYSHSQTGSLKAYIAGLSIIASVHGTERSGKLSLEKLKAIKSKASLWKQQAETELKKIMPQLNEDIGQLDSLAKPLYVSAKKYEKTHRLGERRPRIDECLIHVLENELDHDEPLTFSKVKIDKVSEVGNEQVRLKPYFDTSLKEIVHTSETQSKQKVVVVDPFELTYIRLIYSYLPISCKNLEPMIKLYEQTLKDAEPFEAINGDIAYFEYLSKKGVP